MSNYRLKAAAVIAVIIGGGLLLYEPPKKIETPQKIEPAPKIEPEKKIQGFGVIDFDQVINKHRDGEKLKELIGREIRLKLELNELMRPVFPPKLPEIDTTPFEKSAREKIMQNLISQLAEVRARKKRIAEDYKKQTEEEYLRRRNANREIFINETFNITLKLQNAKTLHLTPEQIEEYQKRLDELTMERNTKQRELLEEWTAEIEAYADKQVAEDLARIKREAQENEEKYGEEAMQKLRETQERNRILMEAANQEVALRNTRRQEILDELLQTTKNRSKLEDEILNSITGEVGKLGAMYKLQMVFIRSEPRYAEEQLAKNAEMIFKLTTPKSPGVSIIGGKDIKNLTKDLLKTVR